MKKNEALESKKKQKSISSKLSKIKKTEENKVNQS